MRWDWLDPIHGAGYQFWSGIGGALIAPALIGLLIYATPTRCKQIGCLRKAKMITTGGVAFCHKHLPDGDEPPPA